jgi:flagellar biosynthetic protein FliO
VSKHIRKTAILCAALIVGGGLAAVAARSNGAKHAAPETGETPRSFLSDPNLPSESNVSLANTELLMRLAFAILVVIGLGAATLYVSRKVLPKVTHAANKEIRVVETTYLGPRKSLHLVEIGGRRLLLGSTHDRIATLAHLSDTWLDLSKQDMDDAVKT